MVKPIFQQKFSKKGTIGPRLHCALTWWLQVLSKQVAETWEYFHHDDELCHLFLDAASTPPRCAAVLFANQQILYTDVEPPEWLMEQFQSRNDKQITTLVRVWLALALGLG